MDKNTLLQAQKRISPFIHRTPVVTSTYINSICNAEVVFKCENFQRMGAFKMRGATNAIMQLSESQRQKGVVTHSSGNFAQALALAAKSLGVASYIVMPKNAPKVKVAAVKGYGGNITFCGSTMEDREVMTRQIIDQTKATFIHPSNDLDVILGNGTSAMELLEDVPDLQYIVAPVGGGGLIAGTALAAHFFGNGCSAIGAEPKEMDDAFRSLISGKIESNQGAITIADGLRTQLGSINFPIIQQYLESVITVEESEIKDAMRIVYERMKIVVEPSSAVALAAVLKSKEKFKGKKIGIILSGGNIDLADLTSLFKV